MDARRLTMADLETAHDGTMHTRFRETLVTIVRHRHDAWEATAWPDDGRTSIPVTEPTPEQALERLIMVLERRI